MGGTEPLIVSEVVKDSNTRLDKTWQEIYDAPIAYLYLESYGLAELPARLSLTSIGQTRGTEDVIYFVAFDGDSMKYYANSEDGYPIADYE